MNSEKNTENRMQSATIPTRDSQIPSTTVTAQNGHATMRLGALMLVDPPATYGNGTHAEQLYSIHVPTDGGKIWITHVGDNSTLHEHAKGTMRALAASNVKADAGAWPKAEAEEYLKEARKMWICATMRRAE